MALSILRLSSSFPEIFGMSSAFTFENIVQMLQIHDTLNHGCYKTVTEKDFDKFEKKKGAANEYQLYCRRNGSDGTSVWEALEDAESAISSSTEIYFKKRGATGKDDADYVQLYSLIQLDPAKFNEAKSFKHDPATYVASLLYATCCMHKKMMELYMADIEAINDEQKEMNEIMNLLKQMQEDLAALDAGVTDETKHNKAPLDEVVLKFFLTRGLLDTNATQGVLTKDVIEELKAIYLHGKKGFDYVQQFKQWSTFTALLGLQRDLKVLNNPRQIAPNTPDNGIKDPFASCYWRRPSDVEDDPYSLNLPGLEDQWIFSPYIRDDRDNFLAPSGSPPSSDNPFNNIVRRATLGGGARYLGKYPGLDHSDKDSQLPSYPLRWYGKNPPKNSQEFWKGIAALLRKNDFLPANLSYFTHYDGRSSGPVGVYYNDTFNERFLADMFLGSDYFYSYESSRIHGPGDQFVAILNKEGTQIKRFLDTFEKNDLNQAYGGGPQDGEIAVALGRVDLGGNFGEDGYLRYASDQSYWPVLSDQVDPISGLTNMNKSTNAWEQLMEKTPVKAVQGLELNSDQVTTWTDTLRIYCDRISNESSSQSSQMNTELQYSQQFLNTATQLLAKLNRMMTDIASHIH